MCANSANSEYPCHKDIYVNNWGAGYQERTAIVTALSESSARYLEQQDLWPDNTYHGHTPLWHTDEVCPFIDGDRLPFKDVTAESLEASS